MKPTLITLCLALAVDGAASGADTRSTATQAAAAASSPASAADRATRAGSAACASPGASVPRGGPMVTSKVRHIPVEGDPCADSSGIAPPLPR